MGLAKVGLLYLAEHWYFLLDFVLNLNFSTFKSPPSPSPKTLAVRLRKTAQLLTNSITPVGHFGKCDRFI